MKISLATARRLALQAQGLDGQWSALSGEEGVAHTIERLGYVQIDTISVVQRAHHHTLWSRVPDYSPDMLHELQATKRRVFEYWVHAACYVPMCDYRYYLRRMRAAAKRPREWFLTAEGTAVIDHVLDRIRNEGPLASADFKEPGGRKRGTWWDWKPAKQALERLFNMGTLMVAERRNFHRVYDLTERILPSDVDTSLPSDNEMDQFVIRRALATKGLATIKELHWGWQKPSVERVLHEFIEDGEVEPIRIAGRREEFYALADALTIARKRSRRAKRLHILSPFDSAVIDRRRLDSLFGFDFKLECYLPAPKRKYGYFCLPVLWGNEFIGRIDAKADRKKKSLILRAVVFEPGCLDYDAVLPVLADKLTEFAEFNGCDRITINDTDPAKIRTSLERELRRR
ncbi:winged helix-turn-helix domain-containing protein [Candidatus Hydrogenedentota bacterium]